MDYWYISYAILNVYSDIDYCVIAILLVWKQKKAVVYYAQLDSLDRLAWLC